MTPRPRPRASARRSAENPRPYDWLRVVGIQAYGRLGVTRRERELGQRVEADVEVAYPPVRTRRPDSLKAHIDYEALDELVRREIEGTACRLLETLADAVARKVLAAFPAPRVRVRVRKLHVPVAGFTGTPEVVVERSRQ